MPKSIHTIWQSDARAARGHIPDDLMDLLTPEDDLAEVATSLDLLGLAGLDTTSPEVFALAVRGARTKADAPAEFQEKTLKFYQRGELTRRSRRTCVVYYARNGNRVKIGFSIDVAKRMQSLSTEELLVTEPGARVLELERHVQFAALRTHGEWFRLEEPLTSHIEELRKATGWTPAPCPRIP